MLTDQLIRRGVHQSVVALENDVRRWITNWNQDPKPTVWTKTAEDIVQGVSRGCPGGPGPIAPQNISFRLA